MSNLNIFSEELDLSELVEGPHDHLEQAFHLFVGLGPRGYKVHHGRFRRAGVPAHLVKTREVGNDVFRAHAIREVVGAAHDDSDVIFGPAELVASSRPLLAAKNPSS